jgi:sialate O-acetylesterase
MLAVSLGVLVLLVGVARAQVVGGQAAFALAEAAAQQAGTQPDRLLAGPFRDHAVFQRDRPIVVWGEAAAGDVITVTLATASAQARADASGRWRATLPAMHAGGPFELTARIATGVSQSVHDALVGDVFLCSGQSNMELPVERTGNVGDEIANSANNTIRMLTVAHASSPVPLADFEEPVHWQIAAPETVPRWSAACFYFARELQKTIHVPIGLVHSSWGGANIRPWMSAVALEALGGYETALQTLALYAKDTGAAQARFAEQWQAWWRGKSGDHAGAEPWAIRNTRSGQAGARDWRAAPPGLGDWRKWGVAELRDFTGLVWYRTHINLSAAQATSAVRLDLGPINQVDETWINGRAIGNTFGYDAERAYTLAPGVLHAGDNLLVLNVLSTYGKGGLLAGGPQRALHLSSGESVPLEGPWQYSIVPSSFGYPPRAPWESVGGVATLYNAMIAPLGSYGLRGVLWYQGESNTGEAQTYAALLGAMMADWRRQFAPDLPFLVVQLPNYGRPQAAPGEESEWAALREGQRAAVADDRHAGLAVTIDIGEPGNLHPTNKQDVGTRLARVARHVIYGESMTPSGPVASSATRTGNGIVVDFGDVEGALTAYGNDHPIGFELCTDAPRTCRFAYATITGTRVVLAAPENGAPPTRVRYCWADSPVCTLFDKSGLPAGPFQLPIHAQ